MGIQLEGLKEGLKPKIILVSLRATTKKYLTGTRQDMKAYMNTSFKKLTSIHNILAIERNRCQQKERHTRMDDKRKDYSDPKRHLKTNCPNYYRPITCLPMMWKILTPQIREEIYYLLIKHGLFSEKKKGCCKWTGGTRELLYIDQPTINTYNANINFIYWKKK